MALFESAGIALKIFKGVRKKIRARRQIRKARRAERKARKLEEQSALVGKIFQGVPQVAGGSMSEAQETVFPDVEKLDSDSDVQFVKMNPKKVIKQVPDWLKVVIGGVVGVVLLLLLVRKRKR